MMKVGVVEMSVVGTAKSVCGKAAGLIDSVSLILHQPGDSKFGCLLNQMVRLITKFIDANNQTVEHRFVEVCPHHELFVSCDFWGFSMCASNAFAWVSLDSFFFWLDMHALQVDDFRSDQFMRCSGCVSKLAPFFANNSVAFFVLFSILFSSRSCCISMSGCAAVPSSAVEVPMKQFEEDTLCCFHFQTLHVFDVFGLHPSVGSDTHAVTTHVPRARHQIFSLLLQRAAGNCVARVLQLTTISPQCCPVLSRVLDHFKPRPAGACLCGFGPTPCDSCRCSSSFCPFAIVNATYLVRYS